MCSLWCKQLWAIILLSLTCSVVTLWVRHLALVTSCLAWLWLLPTWIWLWLLRWPRVSRTKGVVHEVRRSSRRAKKTKGHGLVGLMMMTPQASYVVTVVATYVTNC